MLQDIAILTGGQVISSELGLELSETTMEQLGRARQVVVQKENTIIVDGAGNSDDIKARVGQIKSQIENTLLISTEKSFRKDLLSFQAA